MTQPLPADSELKLPVQAKSTQLDVSQHKSDTFYVGQWADLHNAGMVFWSIYVPE